MRTKEEIYYRIEFYTDRLHDHHLWLNDSIVRNALIAIYESAISNLRWVLNEPPPPKEENAVE